MEIKISHTLPVIQYKKHKRKRSFSLFGKYSDELDKSISIDKSFKSIILLKLKSEEIYNQTHTKISKKVSMSLSTSSKDNFTENYVLKIQNIINSQKCPICLHNKNIHILDYWKERKEFIFHCSNIINDLNFKICSYIWTSTQLIPLCICNNKMKIESHYDNYYYVCLYCKCLSHSTKEES